jgi:hypothetical protein
MFFSLGLAPEPNFSNCVQLGRVFLNTDAGWHRFEENNIIYYYKGYCDNHALVDVLSQLNMVPSVPGNFCVFRFANDQIDLLTSQYRSFPIYCHDTSINNLVPGPSRVWCDESISIDQNLNITRSTFDAVGPINTDPIGFEDAVVCLDQIIGSKVERFVKHNQLPIKVYLSGGIDSMLVYSYLQRYTDRYQIVTGQCVEYDEFLCHNLDAISKNWAYRQLHHWREDCVLASGAPGDEFMLRNPETSNLFLMSHGTSVLNYLVQDSLMQEYFSKEKHVTLFHAQQQHQSTQELVQDRARLLHQLCNINLNDFQHWHIGRTLTYTPLRDLEIFKVFLRLDLEDAVDQIIHARISQQLIATNNPRLLDHLSPSKNTGEILSRMWPLLEPHI